MADAAQRFLDLSHTVEHGLVTYRGLPTPIISDHLSRKESQAHYAPGTTFHIGRIEMVANTGTYIDSPFHRYEGGADLAELPLASLADLPGVLIQGSGPAIDIQHVEEHDVRGRAVLIYTGWSVHWGTETYFDDHPYLTARAARWLREHGVALVGIDSYNIDDTATNARPVHSELLAAGIPIVEHLTGLEALAAVPFRFFAVPVKVRRFGTFPVRAFAITDQR